MTEVEGTELYTVKVELDDKANIIDTHCDCPYDMGEYCKHQVAVFLTLRDMKSNASGKNNSADKNTISKDGGKDQALVIKQKLFTKYANRPAFRDELTRI